MVENGLLIAVYGLLVALISRVLWRNYRQRFSFHLIFSVLYLITFFAGLPFSLILQWGFGVQSAGAEKALASLLLAGLGYGAYLLGYQGADALPKQAVTASGFLAKKRTVLTACLLALLAVGTLGYFVWLNGWLLFRLEKYSQIFSPLVNAVALKRFFYFFLPALLIGYFLRPTRQMWWGVLWLGGAFGLLSYLAVGGTRANLALAVAFFLWIGLYHRYLTWKWLALSAVAMVAAMFFLALARYGLAVEGREAWITFLYLSRDTFSPWENFAQILAADIEFQGLMPIVRDFYVYIPKSLWAERPDIVWNTANYFTKVVLGNQSGLAMSPTLLGAFYLMGGLPLIIAGCAGVGVLINATDRLFTYAEQQHSALLKAYCFGNLFNLIVLVREGADSFVSRWLFFSAIFGICWLVAGVIAILTKGKSNG